MEAEELENRAKRALEKQSLKGSRDKNGSTNTYKTLCKMRQIRTEMADCHRNLCANSLRKRDIYIEKLECMQRLARLEAKLGVIQQAARKRR